MMNQPLSFHPPVIAHRGASGYAPENTIAAFVKAAQLGVKWVEFDVLLAACGKPVLIHDAMLSKTTTGTGKVHEHTFAALQSLDAGRWFDAIYAGERIPSLVDAMTFLQGVRMNANVELKSSIDDERLVKQVVKEMAPFLEVSGCQVLFSSFSFNILKLMRKYAPQCQLGMLLHDWEPNWLGMCENFQCASINVSERILTRDEAMVIKGSNKALLCYTVNNVFRAKELFSWGVDAVFTDFPDKILDGLSAEA